MAAQGASRPLRARGDDAVLYQDLPWDFCGPRIGVTGLGGVTQPSIPSDAPVDAIADQAEYDRVRDLVTLRGGVEFTRGDQTLRAERSTYDRRSGGVEAEGDVYFEYAGARLTADSGRYSLQTKEGELENVGFRLSGNANLRGTAGHAELLAGERTRYRDVIYTTCPPGRSDWSLRASDLLLDHADGMGTAHHARIRLGGVPVLYSPYLRFPIDDRRRSGFLVPSFGSSSLNGTEITIPYYWNIAPNYDATFYPRLMSSRGLMLGAQFRHLASFQKLEVNGEVIPNDSKSAGDKTRGAIRIQQTGQLGRRWSSMVDYSSVTDDRYLADFGNRLDLTSLRNLTQRGDLGYTGDGYRWLVRVQDFQTIDPTIPARSRPYAQMPHGELYLGPSRQFELADLALETRYDYFDHSAKVHGNRLVL
ncbi:MAG: LPS-assembly protein LptD, partial [Bdellovibrio bacteriovorus]